MDPIRIVCDTIVTKAVETPKPVTESDVELIVACVCGGLVALFFIVSICLRKKGISERLMASAGLFPQIIGALLQWRFKYCVGFLLLSILSGFVSWILSPGQWLPVLWLILLNLVVWSTIKVCRKLTDVFSLRKQDEGVTWCYISILISVGFWIVAFVLMYNTKDDPKVAAAIAIIGTILSIVFKDKIAGVVAFLHLRMHHLLKIGDWIKVPKLDVDGEVKRLSLTSVVIYNWDTTTSVIPISALHSDHFKNLQNMMNGKTYGRRMYSDFILDTECFHTLSQAEIDTLKKHDVQKYLPEEEMVVGALNARLFRLYLYHKLMNHPHISQQPRLIIRWMEQKEGGMPLQVYAFIIDSSLAPFEWQRSQIVEDIIDSMEWFGLRLYQSPSAYDVKNINNHTNNIRVSGKEVL